MGITLAQSEEKRAGSRKGRPNYDPVLRERLAAAACEPGVSVAKLAREHGINANMLFAWRRRYRAQQQPAFLNSKAATRPTMPAPSTRTRVPLGAPSSLIGPA